MIEAAPAQGAPDASIALLQDAGAQDAAAHAAPVARTTLRLAGPGDDALLRRLLRENPMPGWVEITLEREPDFFADDCFGTGWAALAEDGGRPVGMYSAAVLPLWVNGAEAATGYLGGLRVQPDERRRLRHLRAGYASVRRLAPLQPDAARWFTVVADDNTPARRLLEAGLPGLPRYRPVGRLLTHALPRSRARAAGQWRRVGPDELPRWLAWQRSVAAAHQLAPALDAPRLQRLAGTVTAWAHEDADGPAAFAVWWDRRATRQVVARRYGAGLRRWLPLANAWAALARRVPLPAEGAALPQAWLAFLALAPRLHDDPGRGRALLADLLAHCPAPVAALGLQAAHPWTPMLAGFHGLSIAGQVYTVAFDGDPPAPPLDGRPVQPEAALL